MCFSLYFTPNFSRGTHRKNQVLSRTRWRLCSAQPFGALWLLCFFLKTLLEVRSDPVTHGLHPSPSHPDSLLPYPATNPLSQRTALIGCLRQGSSPNLFYLHLAPLLPKPTMVLFVELVPVLLITMSVLSLQGVWTIKGKCWGHLGGGRRQHR